MVSTVFIKITSLIVGFLIGLIAFIIYFHKIKMEKYHKLGYLTPYGKILQIRILNIKINE
jgi:hypothetical protein